MKPGITHCPPASITSGQPRSSSGVVEIAKTSALAISVGDVLYWDATNSVVNKTTSSQRAVGVAVEGASNPSATVKMQLGVNTLAGT